MSTPTATCAQLALPAEARVAVPSCPVCGALERDSDVLVLRDLLHGVPGVFHYDRCRRCRSVYQSPRVTDDRLEACYPPDYFTHTPGPTLPHGRRRLDRLRALVVRGARCRRDDSIGRAARVPFAATRLIPAIRHRLQFGLLDALDAARSCGTSLEIGPGTGADMWRMAALGWDAQGLDIDATAARAAAAQSGCPVHVGPLESFRPGHRYDLVYASHSVEHLPQLAAALQRCADLLKPRGRIVLVVPNPSSIVSRSFGGFAPAWDPPRHLVLATPRALSAALTVAGFRNVRVSTTARRASHYAAIADARRLGVSGNAAWTAGASARHRLLALLERALVEVGIHVGEEIVVTAEVP